jgi:hypothetical protein
MNFKLLITSALFPENQFSIVLDKTYSELCCYNQENIDY